MTIREIIEELTKQGHVVEFYERPDGGVLIKSIDGVKFKGATGNAMARQMTGQTISEKRKSQLTKITESRTTGNKELDKILRKVQKKWNKAFGKKKKRKKGAGKITAQKVKWRLEHKGLEETKRSLKEKEKYAEGIAYELNVQSLADEVRRTGEIYSEFDPNGEFERIALFIESTMNSFREEWIYPCYEVLYEIDKFAEKGLLTRQMMQEFGRQIKNIIHMK